MYVPWNVAGFPRYPICLNFCDWSIAKAAFPLSKSVNQLIKSLISQTYAIDEIIISDAKSNDKTIEIIREFIKSGINIKLAKREGLCRGAGRNAGISFSSNETIALIDAIVAANHLVPAITNNVSNAIT